MESTGSAEAALVALHRQGARFDPNLSLVAEEAGRLLGHVLFYPRPVQLYGQTVPSVLLSPAAVHPDAQGRGVGSQIIWEGHKRAVKLGYAVSLVLGHPTYYPRFGYQTNAYGYARVSVRRSDVGMVPQKLTERRPGHGDLPWLQRLWRTWFHDVDLAMQPEPHLSAWLSPNPGARAVVVEADEEPVGYVSYSVYHPERILRFLAKDAEAVKTLLRHLFATRDGLDVLNIPVHPDAEATHCLFPFPYDGQVGTWAAGMLKPLQEEHPLVLSYLREIQAGVRAPGLVTWPVEFDVC